jgi:hypothetical protein
MQLRADPLRQTLLSGVAAGAAGGVLLNLYLVLTISVFKHWTDPATLMKFVASGIMGSKAAYSSHSSALIGTLIFYAIALVWGLAYAYVASTEPPLASRPLVSGIAFGLIVFVVMQVVELTVKIWTWSPFIAANSIVGHVLAFGIPVAYIVARWPYRS